MMMLVWAILIWIGGLLTAVPCATYYLFVHAERDQYALLITFVLFWIFGYWGVAGPILSALKLRALFRAIERAQSETQLREAFLSDDAQDVAIDLLASENGIPRFVAARILRLFVARQSAAL